MGDMALVRGAFAATNEFLAPVLQRGMPELQKYRGNSLLEILEKSLPGSYQEDTATRARVIGKALDLLHQIHVAFVAPVNDGKQVFQGNDTPEDVDLEDAKRRRMLHTLLDLISLEGIYPSLSSGVGIPLQQRVISVLPPGVIAQHQSTVHEVPSNESFLECILVTLSGILFDTRPSIQPVIRGRILSDLISAASDLGYNPNIALNDNQDQHRRTLSKLIADTPSAVLLQTLSSFLQSNPVSWFKSIISTQLSNIPLRQGGVLQTIIFLASQLAPSLGQESQTQGSDGPHITVNAIMQSSRLLSSVPQGMEPAEYFSSIGPQLLTLVDGDDPDLRKAAAYIVGNGILGKRAYGAPGMIGHSIFLEPIFKTLTGSLDESSSAYIASPYDADGRIPEDTLVREPELILAVDRLKTLVLQPPNPSLVKRIVYPVLLPLWGLACLTTEKPQATLHTDIMTILQTYFGISVGSLPLKKIVDNFLWDGSPAWVYDLDFRKRVILRKCKNAKPQHTIVGLTDILESRVKIFMALLSADPNHDELTGEVFLHASERWLVKSSSTSGSENKLQLVSDHDDPNNILQKIIGAKLAQTLLDNFKDTLSRRPLRVLELIKHIIDGELNEANLRRRRSLEEGHGKMSLNSLANIVPSQGSKGNLPESDPEPTESLSIVFSLLSTILASPEFSVSEETSQLLGGIKDKLDLLLPHLPQSLSKSGTTASMLLEILLTSPRTRGSEKAMAEIPDFETHRRALTNLNSDLPPVQAEGFSLLSDLVKKSSPILDIPSTLTLLLSIITDSSETTANDEFIYLNAIKLIGTLASRHPRTVVKTLIDRYIDRSENATLDQRLKIGESLLRTVQDLGEALMGDTAKILGEGLGTVAGRRSQKPEAQRARKKMLDKARREKERENRQMAEVSMPPGWKLSSAALNASNIEEGLQDEDSQTETSERATHSANIISAWAAGAESDAEPDDLRVRASALSILATAVQTNITGLGCSIVASAVDLALSTLTLEPGEESAILRRASCVLLLDILRAVDTTREARGSSDVGFGFSLADGNSWRDTNSDTRGPRTIGNIPHMLQTLAFVESRETDSIVRGHIRVLMESLEAWIEKSLLWDIGDLDRTRGGTDEPRTELGDQIAGLQINPLAGKNVAARPRIEEIE